MERVQGVLPVLSKRCIDGMDSNYTPDTGDIIRGWI